jgi:hypothetical protein
LLEPDWFTGGNGEAALLGCAWFGRGAGNAPWATASTQNAAIAVKVNGIRMRQTLTIAPWEQVGPPKQLTEGAFYDYPNRLTTR